MRDRDGLEAICMENIETVSRMGMVIKIPNLDNKSCGEPAGGPPPMAKLMRKEA